MLILLVVLLALVSIALIVSVMLNRKLLAFAQRFEENYTTAQDLLDETYQELDALLTREMVSDDPIVRRVMAQFTKCRNDVFNAAKLISMQNDEDDNGRGNE